MLRPGNVIMQKPGLETINGQQLFLTDYLTISNLLTRFYEPSSDQLLDN